MNIPTFQPNGLLPPGDYEVSLDELRRSVLVSGPLESSERGAWDSGWRSRLVDNLEMLAKQLWQVGIREIYADGSFAEDKDHPNDIDGYFVCSLQDLASGEMARQLNLLDPFKVWTWDPLSRKPYRGYPKKQLPMWHRYRVELYPHVPGLGLGSGILTDGEMSSNSRRRFASRGGMARREASSKSNMEDSYDPQ
jgi:hypothetical protein